MTSEVHMRVKWNSTIESGRYTAFAEEEKGGYRKGDVVASINGVKKPKNLPDVIAALSKNKLR